MIGKSAASPRLWLWIHACGAVIWVGLSIPGLTTWRDSVPFLVFVSLYAIVLTHVVGAVAAIGGCKADRDDPL